ncbi:MAG: cadherin-like beta sandwich domain-containing protein, partial [Clostridia bacterium]|nr:cadherin-like beta sandwich domain-containing protein [Clostridia bacterium]
RSMFYAGGRLRILGGDRIYVLENGVPVDSGIAAETADGKGNLIVWTMDGQLFGSDGVRTAVCPCDAAGLMTDGTYAVAGKDVYRYEGDVWSFIGTSELRAEALSDGCAAGPDGLFLLDSLEPLSRFDAGKRKVIAAGTGCGILILTGDDALLQCFSPDLESRNAPFWTDPGISGCDNGKLYRESARITFSFGAGFVDGNRISSGSRVTDAGEHVFRLVLPCGIVYESAFRVVPALTGIAFLRQNYRLPVNESGTFAVVYLPEEASRVSVYYTADSDCIALDGEGHFRALREGRATVTARTEDGRFSATCSVEVTSAVLLFSEESGYRVDRMNGLLLGVPGNTSSDSLLAAVRSAGRTELSSETAGTGSVVRLFGEDGQILDELTVAVAGDADGDGYVTLSDLLLFETWMERPDEMTPEAKAAADIDGSGTVTSRDMNRLRSQLLYESGFARRDLPPESRDGQAELLIPSSVRFGEPVRVLIGLTGCETAVGFSGRLTFDPDRWTYDRTESYGWDLTESANRKGQVSFLASGDPAGDLHPVLAVYLIPKETEDGEAPAELLLRDLTVVWEDRTLSLPRQEKTVVPEAAAYGEPNIGAEGMDPFDPARREYELSLPYDTYFVDLTVTRPENVRVDVGNTVFRNGNHLDVSVRFLYPDGTEEAYLIRAFRDGVRPKNGDSSLAALQAEGYELDFSPDRTEYRITVPRGTEELHLSFEPARKESTVRTEGTELNGDLEENVVRVIVTAEDGTETVYRILVSFEGDVPEESVSLPPVSEPPVSSGRIGWILLGLVAVGLASAVTGLILQRTKNKNR